MNYDFIFLQDCKLNNFFLIGLNLEDLMTDFQIIGINNFPSKTSILMADVQAKIDSIEDIR